MEKDKRNSYASVKPSEELLGLFQQAEKLDVNGLARAEIYERAERYLVENQDKIDFKHLSKGEKIKYDGVMPSSFKVRINDAEIDSKVNTILREKYNIFRIKTPFKLKVVLSSYIDYLRGAEIKICKSNNLDAIRIKAISLVIETNNEQLLSSIIKKLEEEYL